MTAHEVSELKELLKRLRLATGSIASLANLPSVDSQQTQVIDLLDDDGPTALPPTTFDGAGYLAEDAPLVKPFDPDNVKPLSTSNRRSFLPGVKMNRSNETRAAVPKKVPLLPLSSPMYLLSSSLILAQDPWERCDFSDSAEECRLHSSTPYESNFRKLSFQNGLHFLSARLWIELNISRVGQ